MHQTIKHSHVVGIDYGTGNTVLSHLDETGTPKTVPNQDGEQKTLSVVYVDPEGKEIQIGSAAENMTIVDAPHVLRETKRDLGSGKIYFTVDSILVSPEWAAEQIIRYVRKGAFDYFGDPSAATQGVVTVPARFDERQRQAVKTAAEAAGMTVLGLINEPTAAGLAYGLHVKQGDRTILVLDLGSGTFDATVLVFQGVEIQVLASEGDVHLGGKDVDQILLALVREEFRSKHRLEVSPETHPADWFAAREEVIRQKHLLSSRTEVTVRARIEGCTVEVPVTRDRLRSLLKDHLDRFGKVAQKTLESAKVDPSDLNGILFVGGSSRLEAFRQQVGILFGKDRIISGQVSPDLAVSEGAVLHAAKLIAEGGAKLVTPSHKAIPAPPVKHTDVTPHSLGVVVQDPVTLKQACSVMLKKDTPIPCSSDRPFGSVTDRQESFQILVVQGEEGQPLSDCLTVAERTVEFPARPSSQPSLTVTMGYDASGMVTVQVEDGVSGRVENLKTDFYAKTTA